MREIPATRITDAIATLCVEAACDLPSNVEVAIKEALGTEQSPFGRYALEKTLANIDIARSERNPLCQDTGMVTVFAEIGQDVHIVGGLFSDAVNEGVRRGYKDGYLRKSIVDDPLFERINTEDNSPAVIHISFCEGDSISLTVLPKGGGSENMTSLGMLKPADGVEGVLHFVVDSVVCAGGNPCPPTIVGVGIGGNAETSLLLAKHALHRNIGEPNSDQRYAELEKSILEQINASGVGPQGLGGSTTALAVHIEHAPTHIAMLPVAVALNCHVARCKKVVL